MGSQLGLDISCRAIARRVFGIKYLLPPTFYFLRNKPDKYRRCVHRLNNPIKVQTKTTRL